MTQTKEQEPDEPQPVGKIIDLMEALRASLAKSKTQPKPSAEGSPL